MILGIADFAATFGVNWFPCRGVKLQLNVIREAIADLAQTPVPSKPTIWSRVMRVQLTL